ncbi:MAG: AMP-binding protein [Caldilineaceae bacterium]
MTNGKWRSDNPAGSHQPPATSLTYAQLNTRANQLAHHLIELGDQATTVAVAMERSIRWSSVCWRYSGESAYELTPTYPQERIRYMLADSAAPIMPAQSSAGAGG